MKKKDIPVYWYLNIILLFFLCCKFSPVSNHFTSSVFSSVIINYLVIIFNILVGKYAYNKIDNSHRKISIEILVNCMLALIYICSVLVDYSISFRWNITQILISVCSYLMCYIIIMKFSFRNYLLILLIFSLLGTILIGEGQYIKASKQCSEKKNYSFANEKLYKQYKKLYDNFDEIPPYIVLDYTDNSAYVQDLTSGQTEYYSFETQKDKEDFISNHTMGVDVNIPRLGTDVSFNDSKYEVFYTPSFSEREILYRMEQMPSLYFSILMGILTIVSLIGYAYEKNK